jgi:hypothetical protein
MTLQLHDTKKQFKNHSLSLHSALLFPLEGLFIFPLLSALIIQTNGKKRNHFEALEGESNIKKFNDKQIFA